MKRSYFTTGMFFFLMIASTSLAYPKTNDPLSTLRSSVESTVQQIAVLHQVMEQVKIDAQNAEQEINKLISDIGSIKDSLKEDSPLWDDFKAMMDAFSTQQKIAEEKVKDPNEVDTKYWQESMAHWEKQISDLEQIKANIIAKANEIDQKRELLASRRDIIKDALLRGLSEEAKQVLSDTLTEINQTNADLDAFINEFTEMKDSVGR